MRGDHPVVSAASLIVSPSTRSGVPYHKCVKVHTHPHFGGEIPPPKPNLIDPRMGYFRMDRQATDGPADRTTKTLAANQSQAGDPWMGTARIGSDLGTPLALYVACENEPDGAAVVQALEREGLNLAPTCGPLAELEDGFAGDFQPVVVLEPDGMPQ